MTAVLKTFVVPKGFKHEIIIVLIYWREANPLYKKMKSKNLNRNSNWFRFSKWFSLQPILTGFAVFMVFIFITIFILIQRHEISKEAKVSKMVSDLESIQQNLDQSLKNCYTTTLTLALTIGDNGEPQDFDTIAAQLLASNNDIVAVQLVPDGIIKYTYPLKGNEKAIGLNILESKYLKDEVIASIFRRKMYFAGPLELVQGGQGIVGRLPVYNNNRFWGFSAVLINLENLLENAGVNKIDTTTYSFQFSKVDPKTKEETFYLKNENKYEGNPAVSVVVPDGNWKLYLIDKDPNTLYPPLVVPALLGLLVSLWFGYLAYVLVRKPAELQILIKQQTTKLFKSELQFKTIFEQAGIGIALVDIETGRFMEINEHFCKMLGYSEQELKEKSFKEITYSDDLENDLLQLDKVNSGIIHTYSLEKRYYNKQGEIVWVNLTVTPFSNEDGSHLTNISFVQNITARKTADELLANSQQKTEELINTIDGIVWETDANVNFTFISKKVEFILGYTSKEWLSCPNFWSEHIHPDDKNYVLKYCSEQTSARPDHDFEYRMIAKNGETVWLRDIVNLIKDSDGNFTNLRGIMIDITKTKEIEKELHKSFNLVTEQNKRLLNFSYIVSHNLRSHTSNITSIINLIETSDSEEEIQHMLQLLKTVSESLNETMSNLNEVVNIHTNMGLTTEDLNLKQFVLSSLKVLEPQIIEKQVTVNINIDEETVVRYNPAYLESILFNLISNAIRYSDPVKNPFISINVIEQGTDKFLEIIDNGIGIDLVRNGNKIFGMYKTFTNHKDSKGIGLFITKNQIEAMGGNISLVSELNEGTTFKIKIG
jgi:PAS domain S-box-containing protein